MGRLRLTGRFSSEHRPLRSIRVLQPCEFLSLTVCPGPPPLPRWRLHPIRVLQPCEPPLAYAPCSPRPSSAPSLAPASHQGAATVRIPSRLRPRPSRPFPGSSLAPTPLAYALRTLAYTPRPLAYTLRPLAYTLRPLAYAPPPLAYIPRPLAYALRPPRPSSASSLAPRPSRLRPAPSLTPCALPGPPPLPRWRPAPLAYALRPRLRPAPSQALLRFLPGSSAGACFPSCHCNRANFARSRMLQLPSP